MASGYPALYFRVILLLFLVSLVSGRPVLSAASYPQAIYQGHPTFSENICSEDDLRSSIFGTLVVKFLACLPASPRIFEHLKNGVIAHFKRIFTLKRSPRNFGSLFSG